MKGNNCISYPVTYQFQFLIGSMKVCTKVECVFIFKVSIPYRFNERREITNAVRLRGVSIPYRFNERTHVFGYIYSKKLFQFLIGSMKASPECGILPAM